MSSSSVTPIGVPSNPTITSVTAQDGALSVAFTAPSSGSTPTSYEYQLNASGTWLTASTTTSPIQISGLTNGTLYSVQIRADSVVGEGAASSASSGTPEGLPGAPSISSLSTGVGTVSVSFTPGYSGGDTIIDYEYELNNSGTWTSGGNRHKSARHHRPGERHDVPDRSSRRDRRWGWRGLRKRQRDNARHTGRASARCDRRWRTPRCRSRSPPAQPAVRPSSATSTSSSPPVRGRRPPQWQARSWSPGS